MKSMIEPRVVRGSLHRVLWAAAALVSGGCSPGPAESVYTLDAIVYGRVTDASGAPVAGARVFARHHDPGCSGDMRDEDSRQSTDADGRYRTYFLTLAGTLESSCLLLHAEVGQRKSAPVRFEVEFREEGQPLDSVQVNVVMEGG